MGTITRKAILVTWLGLPTALMATPGDPWIHSSYQTRVLIRNISNVGGQALVDFPVLVKLSNQSFLSGARADGADITFAGVDGSQFFHEIENLDTTNGNLTAWVCLPAFTNQAAIYIYLGNSGSSFPFVGSNSTLSIATNLTNVRDAFIRSNAWNAEYDQVYHFSEDSGIFKDSTRNQYHAVTVDTNIVYQSNGIAGPGIYATGMWGCSGVRLPAGAAFRNMTNSYSFWYGHTVTNKYTNNTTLFDQNPNSGHYLRGTSSTLARCAFNVNLTSPAFPYSVGVWQWFGGSHSMADIGTGAMTATLFTNGMVVGDEIRTGATSTSANNRTNIANFMGTPNTSGNWSGGAWGLADELRVSRVVRATNWMISEYSNTLWARNGYAIDPPEYSGRPVPLSPTSGTVTNHTVAFTWAAGNYPAALDRYLVTLRFNGTNGFQTDVGTNRSFTTNLGAGLGYLSTNAISWWVTAFTAGPSNFDSTTNAFTAAYVLKSRLQGVVRFPGGQAAPGTLIQYSGSSNGYAFCDLNGRFDLGSHVILQPMALRLTPSGSTGGLPLSTNLTVPLSDADWTLTVTNAATGQIAVGALTRDRAVVVVLGQRPSIRVKLPDTWSQQGITTVSLQPLWGGLRAVVWSGLAGIAEPEIEIPLTGLSSQVTPGVYLMEIRQGSMRGDATTERVDRRMVMVAK